MDGLASAHHQHEMLSRQALMYLLTMGWSLAHTSLAMTSPPESSRIDGENVSMFEGALKEHVPANTHQVWGALEAGQVVEGVQGFLASISGWATTA